MSCVIDNAVKETYKYNYDIIPLGDITEIEPKNITNYDILCAGFPCFIAGSYVLTNNGYKNIENVELTDRLLTHTGKFQNILNLQRKLYTGTLYDIKIKFRPEIISSTEDHPYYVCEKKKEWNPINKRYNIFFTEPKWKKASELTMNEYFGMVINDKEIIPEFTFEQSINNNKPEQLHIKLDILDYWYSMGYLISYGWIEETSREDICGFYKMCDTGNNCKKFGYSNVTWYNILKQFGNDVYSKLIPEWVQDAPKECIQEFINGYMKADCYINNNTIVQITTVSLNLAYGLQRLYLKLGHIVSINKSIRSKTRGNEGKSFNQMDTYCIRCDLQKHNSESSFINNNYVWYEPCMITKRDIIDTHVYNFEVENDNSYIVMNSIVHNCQPFSQCGHHKGFDDKRGTLFFNIMKFVDYHKPKVIILENVMRKRLIIIGVRNNTELINHIDKLLDLDEYKKETTLTELLGKNFEKKIAYTIRCGGKNSPIDDKHNWDGYIVDGKRIQINQRRLFKNTRF